MAAATAGALPGSFILRPDLGDFIQDQDKEESCTSRMGAGFGFKLTGEKWSIYVSHWAGRLYDAPGQPLQNVGVSTDGFLTGLEHHGECLLSELPSLGILETPPALARAAAQKRKLDLQPIYAIGDEAEAAIQHALTQGYPCGVVVHVDNGYDNPEADGSVGPESGASRGQHAVLCDGYKTDASGVRWYRSPGSWGTGYGVNGVVWLHQNRIRMAPFLGFARGVVSV